MSWRPVAWGLVLASAAVLLIGLVAASVKSDRSAKPYGHEHHAAQTSSNAHSLHKDESWDLLRGPLAAVIAFGVVTAAGAVAVRSRRAR